MLDFDAHIIGENPKKMLIFLHGYNGTVADHQYALDWFKQYLRDTVLIVPHAPEISDKDPQRFQWYGMLKYDAANRRRQPETSTTEIFAIYNAAAAEIDACAAVINDFIDTVQQQYHIDDAHTFLCGFSQGAMLTIYTALTRDSELGGAFALSGLVAGTDLLANKIHSRPPLYMFHGQDDMKVQYKTLTESEKWLKTHNIAVKTETYVALTHRMNEEEIMRICEIIHRSR